MRGQFRKDKFGLVFGAGLSQPLGFPGWDELVLHVSKDTKIKGRRLAKSKDKNRSLGSITQMLFQKYKRKYISKRRQSDPITEDEEKKIISEWLRIIHKNLYRMEPKERRRRIRYHPYINEFVEIIKQISMTVNYNFDDTLQKLMAKARSEEEESKSRGYETVWDSRIQFRNSNSVIFHPNGFLSENFNDQSSASIIFSDESFGDQLIQTMTGGYTHLINHFARSTCLFIGISLQDSTLKHLLRQNAKANPGHFHYIVHYVDDNQEGLSLETKQAVYDSNFEVYNLITLFLGNKGIKNLAKLIKMDRDKFDQLASKNNIRVKYCYYLIGCVGVGKSTTASYIRSLVTYDEWFDETLELLSLPPNKLTLGQKKTVDKWIAGQFYKKNWILAKEREGIHVVDRTPLDPLTFTEPSERASKAKLIRINIDPRGMGTSIEPGHVIFLSGNTGEIRSRLLGKHKNWSSNDLENLQNNIVELFNFEGVTEVCTRGRSIESVVREVSRIVHNSDYSEANLHGKLILIEGRGK